jgi:hypothetical protein
MSDLSQARKRLSPKPITGFGHDAAEPEAPATLQRARLPVAAALTPEPLPEQSTSAPAATAMPATTVTAALSRGADTAAVRAPTVRLRPATPAAAPTPAPSPNQLSGARTLIRASSDSARWAPREWETFSVRLPVILDRRLRTRFAADGSAFKDYVGLVHRNHYLNAALRQIPDSLDDAAAWGMSWRARSPGRALTTGSGSRLHRDVATAMHDLARWLSTLDVHPHLWEVMAEAVSRLLDELDGLTSADS